MIEIPRPTPFMVDDLKADFVPRKQLKNVINHLVNQEGSVALTSRSALKGMGGYGKTTLAQAVCHNRRIWDKFSDGILWVTLGEKFSDARSLLSDLYTLLSQKTLNLSESHAIKAALNEVLGDQRILLVIDDVWQEEHLKPFLLDCTLLITTRNRELIGPEVESFDVDAMQGDEPYDLLSYGLANATPMKQAFNALAARLGHWPLLLQLVNKTLRKWVSGKQLLPDALQEVNELLTKKGFTAFDNPKNTAQRDQAVRATIEVSLTALGDDRERFLQLAIFPEDTRIPFDALTHLWGLDNHSLKGLCVQLADLSLLRDLDLGQKTILLHDVIHQYLITVLKQPPYMTYSQTRDLPPNEPYLWDHLMHHLIEAGQIDTLNATLHDVHYLAKKTKHKGPLAVENDFKVAIEHADETTRDVWRVYGRYAYLLDNRFEEQDILTNLAVRAGKTAPLADLSTPLAALWELPDDFDPALVRVFKGHTERVTACLFSHDARWVLSAAWDKTLRLWDRETGACIGIYEGHTDWVTACAFSSNDRWVLSASADHTLRLWERETGALIRIYEGHTNWLTACVFSHDNRFVLSASSDRTLRLWDRETA
ncbi:MAG: NB-ARC domain-containing protein, partial [Anaerolineae bacterium]|nr:NB-ARC domain-containing protein [Anaerolineae bacterium]